MQQIDTFAFITPPSSPGCYLLARDGHDQQPLGLSAAQRDQERAVNLCRWKGGRSGMQIWT